MSQGVWVLIAALVLATAFGLYRASRDGRFTGTREVHGATSDDTHGATSDDTHGATSDDTHGAASGARPPTATSGAKPPGLLAEADIDHELGEKATLLQFSSAFCAPCRVTRRTLSEVASVVPGVVHVEVDAEHHLDLVRRLGILRTPTTLVFDADGREVTRATGAPRKDEVLATLANAIGT